MSTDKYVANFDNVKEAANRIKGIAHKTPVLTSKTIFPNTDKTFFFKAECFQKTGSFKFRGALNAVKNEMEIKSDQSSLSLVSWSSGNYAQAMALAARMASNDSTKVTATIVMPNTAPIVKKNAVRSYGATIVEVENSIEVLERTTDDLVMTTGAIYLHPFEDPRVIAGQGTACLELVEQVKEIADQGLDAVIIPVGGGGLASGNTLALRGLFGDKVKIILAEPLKVDDAKRSFVEGKLLKHLPDNKLDSVADGLRTTLGPNTWAILKDMVDDIITVTEAEILAATKLVWERLKVCIEPSAGVAVAVAMGEEFNSKYSTESGIRNVGVILSGGNVDVIDMATKWKELEL